MQGNFKKTMWYEIDWEPLDRQIQERVNINYKGPILMNRRNKVGGVRVNRIR